MHKDLSKDEVDQYIIQVVKEKKPDSVKQLVRLVKDKLQIPEQQILERILYLEAKEKLRFNSFQTPTPEKLVHYLRSSHAYWYWITLILISTTTLMVFTVPEDAFPLVYARYVFGLIFVLWLPGYSFIKALFPQKEIDNIERVALSIGMSLALVPMIGLLLNYTPWGIRLTPLTLSLLALTFTFATAAVIREHYTKLKQSS